MGKLKTAARWTRKNYEKAIGAVLCASGFCLLVWSFAYLAINGFDKPGAKKPEKERTTIRQDVSDIWHHAKCAVKFCDEDGRCPVWSSSYSKCYMLDKDGEKTLYEFQKGGMSKDFFEMLNAR